MKFITAVFILIFSSLAMAEPLHFDCFDKALIKSELTIDGPTLTLQGKDKIVVTRQGMGNKKMARSWAYYFNVKNGWVNKEVLASKALLRNSPGTLKVLKMEFGLQTSIDYRCVVNSANK